ncbi:hypothetical protein [Saccharopolyspora mangrovi]|uniref:Uncharacterized protein n=1 Tax=Saccharopolyspora mangrovi TaxID=3082379 RepID=A0ABU6ADF8_9PSEU|nr:hypothetical protein [Saccharopolyspora sp. S2-29]MEB3369419.1 hypothetical protein [Saccharopolyspora sp. S2-29]
MEQLVQHLLGDAGRGMVVVLDELLPSVVNSFDGVEQVSDLNRRRSRMGPVHPHHLQAPAGRDTFAHGARAG